MTMQLVFRDWFSMKADYEPVGKFPLVRNSVAVLCPLCGGECEYWEGQINQDRQGNDIQGFTWDCHTCKIHSECEEL